MADLKLACGCGEVRGHLTSLSATLNNHPVCYCDDCQAFVHHLGAQASALDEFGGTAIVQVSPCQIHVDTGADQLRCLRLRPKGVTRWYTHCCNTPLANTVSARLSLSGIVAAFIDEPGTALEAVRYRIQGLHALNAPAELRIAAAFPRRMVMSIVLQLLMARIAGRHKPSPFHDNDSRPVRKPDILRA